VEFARSSLKRTEGHQIDIRSAMTPKVNIGQGGEIAA
jgi:hypothetical protein